jgi:hypothetical protein
LTFRKNPSNYQKNYFRFSKFFLPNSGTSDIFQLSQTSNINIPGKWLYMIGSRGITEPQSKLSGAKDKTVALTEDVMQLNDGPVRRSSPGKNVDVKLYKIGLRVLLIL